MLVCEPSAFTAHTESTPTVLWHMGAANRTSAVMEQIRAIEDCVSGKDLKKAKALLSELEKETEPTQPELVRLRAIIKRLEIIGR